MIAVWWILLGVAALDQGIASIGPRFFRREHRARAGAYVCVACWLGVGAQERVDVCGACRCGFAGRDAADAAHRGLGRRRGA